MTDQPYLTESYERRFEADVTRTLDDRIVLDRTHFYPEGGGQPADHGTIRTGEGAWVVTDTEKSDTIYHTLAPIGGEDGTAPADREEARNALPEPGTEVTGELDWDRRYAHMRYHTAQHLLSALLLDEYDASTTGNQLYADRARLDVEHDRFEEADLDHIEDRMNDLVSDARPVTATELDREVAEADLDPERTRISLLPESITEIRIIEIDGYDRTACAGTHVANTEEIGTVSVTGRETRGAGEERVRFVLETE